MSEHERTIDLNVSAEEAFRFFSSVSSLPMYIPYLKSVREDEPDHVFGVAEVDGRRYEVSGFMRADNLRRRIDWESDGTPEYRGWLEIQSKGPEACTATVHISEELTSDEKAAGITPQRFGRELDETLERIRKVVAEQHEREIQGQR
jgi:uncharacterized membrane protein